MQETVRKFDEDEKRTLDKFDLNYFEKDEVRLFHNAEDAVAVVPKEEELTEILVSFFKDSSIERGVKNWRNTVDIYVEALEEWDDVIGGRTRDRENSS